uniref:Dynein light chain n=1 Tax=Alexandrium andersonii TaxID=327968 RepID=A0A6U6TFC7_9DINO
MAQAVVSSKCLAGQSGPIARPPLAAMMDDEGDNEFVGEQVNEIMRNAITKTLSNAQYSKDRVNFWCSTVIDDCLKELAKLNKPFKYIVTCIIMQKNGSALHTGLALYWDTKTDGSSCVQVGLDTMDCITTVYATMI